MANSSIFGNTDQGVPSPYTTHYHPYPTRYHGPRWQNIRAGGQYREAPYSVGQRTLQGIGASPSGKSCPGGVYAKCGKQECMSGMGAYSPADSSMADAIFGAIAGGVVAYHAPKSGRGAIADVLMWAIAGGLGGALLGTIGVGLACAGASVSASVERKLATR